MIDYCIKKNKTRFEYFLVFKSDYLDDGWLIEGLSSVNYLVEDKMPFLTINWVSKIWIIVVMMDLVFFSIND